MTFGVYIIRNSFNGKIYVGSTRTNFKQRWSAHKSDLRKGIHGNERLQRAWNKYGVEAFTFSILEVCLDKTTVIEREQYYMDLYSSYNRAIGYNIRDQAKWSKGRGKWTIESRNKVSLSRKGKKRPDVAVFQKGKSWRAKPIEQWSKTNQYIQTWQSGKIAGDTLGIAKQNINYAALGKLRSAGGFIWKFKLKKDEHDNS